MKSSMKWLNSSFIIAFLVGITICFGYYPFLFAILGGLTVWIFFRRGIVFYKCKALLGWSVICFVWFIGALYSAASIRGLKYTITLVCLLWIALYIRSNENVQRVLFKVLYVMSFVHVLFTVIRQINRPFVDYVCKFILTPSMQQDQMRFFESGTWNGNLGISIQTGWNAFFCIIEIGLAYMFYKKTLSKRHLLLMAMGVVALLLTNKRAHLLALVIAFSVVIIVGFGKKIKAQSVINALIITVVVVVCGIWSYQNIPGITSIFDKISTLAGRSLDTISSGRISIYTETIEYMTPFRWIVGYGTGATDPLIGTDCHNIYIQILFEGGIFALLFFVYVFGSTLMRTCSKIRLQRRNNEDISILLFSLYYQIFFLSYGMLGNPLYDTPMLFLYLISVFIMERKPVYKK